MLWYPLTHLSYFFSINKSKNVVIKQKLKVALDDTPGEIRGSILFKVKPVDNKLYRAVTCC